MLKPFYLVARGGICQVNVLVVTWIHNCRVLFMLGKGTKGRKTTITKTLFMTFFVQETVLNMLIQNNSSRFS